MIKTLAISFFAYLNLSHASNELPEIIDFGKYKSIADGYYSSYEQEAFDFGLYAFNYAPELMPFFALLKTRYHIDTVLETGTYYGGTTLVFGLLFDQTYTIEINRDTHQRAKMNLATFRAF
jgi:predicted O-methyltransferase YrrM